MFVGSNTGRVSRANDPLDGETTVRTPDYVAFWMDSPLCNFYLGNPFPYDGYEWTNSEAAFMYGKAKLFGDAKAMETILLIRDRPGVCKSTGRRIVPYDEQLWTSERQNVMYDVCLAKFQTDPLLKKYIGDTGTRKLIEASTQDLIWGNGLDPFDPANGNPKKWKGLNMLGDVLMAVRHQLWSVDVLGSPAA